MELDVVNTEVTLRRRGARHQKGQNMSAESQREVVSQHVSCNILLPTVSVGKREECLKIENARERGKVM
jgi:hypothetical protein